MNEEVQKGPGAAEQSELGGRLDEIMQSPFINESRKVELGRMIDELYREIPKAPVASSEAVVQAGCVNAQVLAAATVETNEAPHSKVIVDACNSVNDRGIVDDEEYVKRVREELSKVASGLIVEQWDSNFFVVTDPQATEGAKFYIMPFQFEKVSRGEYAMTYEVGNIYSMKGPSTKYRVTKPATVDAMVPLNIRHHQRHELELITKGTCVFIG